MIDAPSPRKPTTQGLRSGLWLVDAPESKPQERRRGPYRPKPTGAEDVVSPWEFISVITLCVCALLVVSLMAGCVSTEFATDRVTVSRVSLFSDVNVEATMGADGSITVKERQAQTAVEAAISRIPLVTP